MKARSSSAPLRLSNGTKNLAQAAEFGRVVALGASNLTLGFPDVVSTARAAWGPDVEVIAALGHGRSYAARSRVAMRTLPGILESGLWRGLESRPEIPTRGLVTDVGNDIVYGAPVEQILAWVEDAICRLKRFTRDIVLTDLPMASIRRLSRSSFLLFRSIIFPACRLSHAQVFERSERVNAGLAELSAAQGTRFFPLKPMWYGFDPIHIRPSLTHAAWQEVLGTGGGVEERSVFETSRLYVMPPERQWLFGIEQFTPQSGVRLRLGGRVWLY